MLNNHKSLLSRWQKHTEQHVLEVLQTVFNDNVPKKRRFNKPFVAFGSEAVLKKSRKKKRQRETLFEMTSTKKVASSKQNYGNH